MNRVLLVAFVVGLVIAGSLYGLMVTSPGSQVSSTSSGLTSIISDTSGSSTSGPITLTTTIANSSTTEQCPAGQNASSFSNLGLTMLDCFPARISLGQTISIAAILRDDSSPTDYSVSAGASITVTNGTGQVMFNFPCNPTQNFVLKPGSYYECIANWSTSDGYDGLLPTVGTYQVSIVFYGIPGMTSETSMTITN